MYYIKKLNRIQLQSQQFFGRIDQAPFYFINVVLKSVSRRHEFIITWLRKVKITTIDQKNWDDWLLTVENEANDNDTNL